MTINIVPDPFSCDKEVTMNFCSAQMLKTLLFFDIEMKVFAVDC